MGESLGSGVASYLAGAFAERVAGPLLVTPFTSFADVAEEARRQREEKQKQQEKETQDESNYQESNPVKNRDKVDTRSAYEILGVQPGDSRVKIDKAYRALCNRYHPDKSPHMSDEFRNESEEELKKILAAYASLK